MPCDMNPSKLAQADIEKALKRLEQSLENGDVSVVVSRQGSVAFKGWNEQDRCGLTDLCAYRRLMVSNSFALRCAVQRAERIAGQGIVKSTLASGVHSHDGGETWGTH